MGVEDRLYVRYAGKTLSGNPFTRQILDNSVTNATKPGETAAAEKRRPIRQHSHSNAVDFHLLLDA